MTQPKTPTPLESFSPQLFNVLIQGAKQRFEIPGIKYRDAVKFRQRCHQLRHQMRLGKHPLASVASKTRLSIEWDHKAVETYYNKKKVAYPRSADAIVTLVIEPHDSEFTAALKAAGIDINKHIDPTTGAAEPPAEGRSEGTSVPSLDKLLGEL